MWCEREEGGKALSGSVRFSLTHSLTPRWQPQQASLREKKNTKMIASLKSPAKARGGQTSSTVTLTPSTSDGLATAPVRRLQAYVCLPLSVSLSTAVTQCTIAVKYRYTSNDWASLQPLTFTYAYHNKNTEMRFWTEQTNTRERKIPELLRAQENGSVRFIYQQTCST